MSARSSAPIEEGETRTDEMPDAVNEDVAVVSIFELQEVADDRVGCEGLDEAVLRLAERG